MQTCILVGGKGSRLGALADSAPKCLTVFNGRPFLDLLLRKLDREGCSHVVLIAGPVGARLRSHLASSGCARPRVSIADTVGGTYDGLMQSLVHLDPCESILCLNGDTILDVSYADLFDVHVRSGAAATIVTTALRGVPHEGAVLIDAIGRVRAFLEGVPVESRGEVEAGVRSASNCGCYCLRVSECTDMRAKESERSLEGDFLPELVSRGQVLEYNNGEGRFLDFGTPDRLAVARASVEEWGPLYS